MRIKSGSYLKKDGSVAFQYFCCMCFYMHACMQERSRRYNEVATVAQGQGLTIKDLSPCPSFLLALNLPGKNIRITLPLLGQLLKPQQPFRTLNRRFSRNIPSFCNLMLDLSDFLVSGGLCGPPSLGGLLKRVVESVLHVLQDVMAV